MSYDEHALLKVLMDNSQDLIYFKDRDSRFLCINNALARNFELRSPKEAIGKTDFEFFPEKDARQYREDEMRLIDTRQPIINLEEKQTWPSGWTSWSSTSKYVMLDKHGAVIGTYGISRNITQRKVAESKRQAVEIELRNAQKMESIGRLAAGIAHEINTPTQFIGDNIRFLHDAFIDLSGLLELYQKLTEQHKQDDNASAIVREIEDKADEADLDFLKEEIPKAIEQALMGVGRVTKIVGAMKDFSHPGSDTKVPFDLNHAIESTITVARNEWKYVADMDMQFDRQLPLVPCLPDQFNQVILNLIINASHAISDVISGGTKGKITIRTSRDQENAIIEVEDTGKGIPDAVRDKIFEPFFTTKEIGKSTGQGLSLARTVIEKMNGTITFTTELGKGTCFRITLPLEDKAPAQEKQ